MKRLLFLLTAPFLLYHTLLPQSAPDRYANCMPCTRWWWFASEIDTNDVKYQLDWVKKMRFGGVELAWIYPVNGDATAPHVEWLSPAWSEAVAFTKRYSDRIGLTCDFTFGTLWPFGDSRVPPGDGTIHFGDTLSPETMRLTWEHPKRGRVINHLDRRAFLRYARRMNDALAPAMEGSPSGLFFDSWEVDTRRLWTPGFDREFMRRFGYDITPWMRDLYSPGNEDIHYDYMALLSDYVLEEFFEPFAGNARTLGGFSRAQCGGSPCDLIRAFATVDVPETEAILYEPNFAKIPASAATLAGKSIVSSETFTCLYGWKGWPGPGPFQGTEQVADMKLVADALFSHGVNQIIWHGMPFNGPEETNRFYASVHVGRDSRFADEIESFNRYMEKVSCLMREGTAFTDVAVYLPLEDAWMGVEYPDSLRFPWVWGEYELRYLRTPEALAGRQPLWINHHFLREAVVTDKKLMVGESLFSSLYVDAEYLDLEMLRTLHGLAGSGLPICLVKDPKEPGRTKSSGYAALVRELRELPNVYHRFESIPLAAPLIAGDSIPDFWCRQLEDGCLFFFANPDTKDLHYPIRYGQSARDGDIVRRIRIDTGGRIVPVELHFKPHQSLAFRITTNGELQWEEIAYNPKAPGKEEPER